MKNNKIIKTFIALILLMSLETAAIAATTGVINKDTVRVRAKATTDSNIVALVSIGDKITILGEEGDWYKVKAKDEDGKAKTGYVRKDLLTVDGETTNVNPTEEPEKPVENNDSGNENVPVQTEEPTNNKQEPEEAPAVEEPNNNITTPVEKDDRAINLIKRTEDLETGKTVTLEKNTKIKILPTANSSNIAEIQANSQVTVIEVINSWCRIETAEGECGWVRIDQ